MRFSFRASVHPIFLFFCKSSGLLPVESKKSLSPGGLINNYFRLDLRSVLNSGFRRMKIFFFPDGRRTWKTRSAPSPSFSAWGNPIPLFFILKLDGVPWIFKSAPDSVSSSSKFKADEENMDEPGIFSFWVFYFNPNPGAFFHFLKKIVRSPGGCSLESSIRLQKQSEVWTDRWSGHQREG